jgi:protease-4
MSQAGRVSAAAAAPAGAPAATQHIYVKHSSGWFAKLLFAIGWIGFLASLAALKIQHDSVARYFNTIEGIDERYHSGAREAGDKVAIIDISGVIVDGEGFVRKQIDAVRQDKQVKAVVVRVDSPGGTVTGSDYIYHHLQELRQDRKIPLVVSMGSMATSGGYYISMAVGDQERSIYAEPTTTTGSIGVIIPHYDLSGMLERFDVRDDSISSHPRKQMLSMTRPIPDEHRQIIQKYVDESFALFKERVKSGRPAFRMNPSTLDELATGEVFTAVQAKKHGLVDELGFLEDAIDRAIELAKLEKNRVRVVRYRSPPTLLEQVTGIKPPFVQPSLDAAALADASTPRAWYLHSSLPLLAAARRD